MQANRQALVGKTFPAHTHTLTSAEAAAYALATNDGNPLYQSGKLAPPMFAVFLEMPALMAAVKAPEVIIEPERFLRLLHGEHDLRWHGALVPGRTYTTQASIARIVEKGSGEIIDLRLETRDEAGTLVVETSSSMFIRAEQKGPGDGKAEAARKETPREPAQRTLVFSAQEQVAKDQSLRYAAASGDHNPIHTDPAVAAKAGLPGIILHGLCTMAFCEKAVVDRACGGDPARLKRLKVRFTKPVLMEQTLDIGAWSIEESAGRRVLGLEAKVAGQLVLKDGVAEVG